MQISKNQKLVTSILVFILFLLVGLYFYFLPGLSDILPALLPAKKHLIPTIHETKKSNNLTSGNFTGIPLNIPSNLRIDVYAKDLGKPRDLIEDSQGNILVSIPERGQVLALLDTRGNGLSDKTQVIIEKLKQPHGLAFSGDTLFIAETNKVVSYSYDPKSHSVSNAKKLFDLPGGSNHWSRSLLVSGYQGKQKLFISIGSSCNACEEVDPRRAAVWFANLDGSDLRSFSTGLRNSVFLTTHPNTGEIWATDNGRDRLGDELPPEEVNVLKEGYFYGWPFCYGDGVIDESLGTSVNKEKVCKKSANPVVKMPAHSAPLGLAFIPENFDGSKNNLLVAFHGSWNSTVPTGYKIVKIHLSDSGSYEDIEDYISGWLPSASSAQVYGRPVDILFSKKGLGYISDDKAGLVYKITYIN